MKDSLQQETQRLSRIWEQYDPETLQTYLVRDVEDPRINLKSILCRHFLTERIFGPRFQYLQRQEIRFGLAMNWLLRQVKSGANIHRFQSILAALLDGDDSADGFPIPPYISETFHGLARPNYLFDALNWYPEGGEAGLPEYLVKTFEAIWKEILTGESVTPVPVLEVACGSANDYRFFASYGLARFLDYRGIDLCPTNIRNASQMFPAVDFRVGNAMELQAPEDSVELCLVEDLFEHLSIEGMEAAVAEVCRVTRGAVHVGFFNVNDQPEHTVRPVGDYHWNTLSLTRTRECFERFASHVETISLDRHLQGGYRCGDTHNKGAFCFTATI